jgi:hypothetical protein
MGKRPTKGMTRRKGIPPDRQLRKRAARGTLPEKLPLVHVTAVWRANEIVRSGKLETRDCSVFPQKLLYFFVLRPAFRSKDGEAKSHQINRFPVVLIVNPDAVPVPYHVYPFDTGGAVSGAFSELADPYIPLEDYELESSHAAAAGHIGWAFGDLENYYDGELRKNLLNGIPDFETITRGFGDIAQIGRSGSNMQDKRSSAVEIAVNHDIDIKGNVLLAILPKQYLETPLGPNDDFIKLLAAKGIDTQVYNWQPNTKPDEFQDEIARIARTWFKGKGFL